ncbi:glucosaminidase domain-containing protein [Mycoplasma sp. P36-A1]|uniref:glucosaminidase domain-containing protein n=1 Tax=Mycoplasma sp. P36-A1 TaxID=3252900 RepID=UPI003C2F070D
MKKILKRGLLIGFIACTSLLSRQDVNASSAQILQMPAVDRTCNVHSTSALTNAITYINSMYHRDAPIISETSNAYKIMVAGVEGWIGKSTACGKNAVRKTTANIGNQNRTVGGNTNNMAGLNVSRYQSRSNKLYYSAMYGSSNTAYYLGYTDLPSGLSNNRVYYSYDGIYYYTNYNTMLTDYRNNRRSNATNRNNPYFDYYSYLPIRTQTKITGAAMDRRLLNLVPTAGNSFKQTSTFKRCGQSSFTNTYNGFVSNIYKRGTNFVSNQRTYNVNAGALYGITINESNYGRSNLSRHYNNPFGWGAVDSCPNNATRYSNMSSAILQYYKNLNSGYANPVSTLGENGTSLGNKASGMGVKYASDSNWGYKNAFNYRRLDEVSGNVDKNQYRIGILKPANGTVGISGTGRINVYRNASTSANVAYYYTRYNASVTILGTTGNFYRIQNDSTTNGGSLYIPIANVHVANTAVNTASSTLNIQQASGKYYAWGMNNHGQLGNGNYSTVQQANRVDLATRIPKNEVITRVIKNGTNNIYILTRSGNVYASGRNNYGQRGTNSRATSFNKINTLNFRVSHISIGRADRLTMTVRNGKRELLYIGRNTPNGSTNKFNRTTNKITYLKRRANGSTQQIRYYSFAARKTSRRFDYDTRGRRTRYSLYTYRSNRNLSKAEHRYYNVSNSRIRRKDIRNYNSRGVITKKTMYYYVNGRLRSTSKNRARRFITTYNNRGKATRTTVRTYNTKGKLGASTRTNIR